MLNFKKILLDKNITQYLLTYVAQCFTWLLMWVYVCSPLPLLMACSSVNYCMCTCACFPRFSSIQYIEESGSWKRKDSSGILLGRTEAHACWAAAMQFHHRVATFRPIHPSPLCPIREDRQVNKYTWKISSSRHCRSTSHPPEPYSSSHTAQPSLARCRLEQTSINNLEDLRVLSRNLCSVKHCLIK